MGQFNTEKVMEEIRGEILENHLRTSDLSFTTRYYRKLVRMLEEREHLILFGAGKYGETIQMALMQEGIGTIRCFCDNSVQAAGSFFCGLEILPLQEAFLKYPDACFVITPKDYDNEILRQLVHAGVCIDNIVIFNTQNTGMVVE